MPTKNLIDNTVFNEEKNIKSTAKSKKVKNSQNNHKKNNKNTKSGSENSRENKKVTSKKKKKVQELNFAEIIQDTPETKKQNKKSADAKRKNAATKNCFTEENSGFSDTFSAIPELLFISFLFYFFVLR